MPSELTVERIQGDIARLEAWDELRDGPVMMRKADALIALRALLEAREALELLGRATPLIEADQRMAAARERMLEVRVENAESEIDRLATELKQLREAAEECQEFLKEQGYPHGHLGLYDALEGQERAEETCAACGGKGYVETHGRPGAMAFNRTPCLACQIRRNMEKTS